MGQFLDWANENLRKIKPKVERKTGVKLEEVVIRNFPAELNPGIEAWTFAMRVYRDKGFIDANERAFYCAGRDEDRIKNALIPVALVHELSHLVHLRLMQDRRRQAEEEMNRVRRLEKEVAGKISDERYQKLMKVVTKKTNLCRKAIQDNMAVWFNGSFMEGFAKYMSLDYLTDIYENCPEEYLESERAYYLNATEYSDTDRPYVEGYKFFKAVINTVGSERIYEVAKTLPTYEEILEPQKYLSRNLPKNKGIIIRDSR